MPGYHSEDKVNFGASVSDPRSGGSIRAEQPIPLSLHNLRAAIEELAKNVSIHAERIDPVLKPSGPEPGEINKNGTAPRPVGTQLSGVIDGLAGEVKSISDRVVSLTYRLGLE